jgi:hypothetical protein
VSQSAEFELLLRRALAPVDPPADLADRLEAALSRATELAVDELEAWELSAMKDPRNWVRPAAAVVVGTTAGAALVLVRARRRSQRRRSRAVGAFDAAERAMRDVYGEARRVRSELSRRD